MDLFLLITGYSLIGLTCLTLVACNDQKINIKLPYALVAYVMAIALLSSAGRIDVVGIVVLLVALGLAVAPKFIANKNVIRAVGLLLVLITLALAAHAVKGIENVQLFSQVVISPLAGPIDLYINMDKSLAAICLLIFVALIGLNYFFTKPISIYLTAPLWALPVLVVAYFTGLDLDPKLPEQLLAFAVANFIFSVIAEEVLFRGILQGGLQRNLQPHTVYAGQIALTISALIFGLVHLGGGLHFAILATFAGLIYGQVYRHSGRLGMAIAVHGLVNIGHFVWLVYPVPN